jgi:hypothetical protein
MELIKSYIERGIRMNEEIRDLLGEEIKTEIRNLSTLEAGSKEKSKAIEDLAKLYRLRIDETRNEDIQFKKDQLREQVKDRYFRLGVEAVSIILPLMFYATWMKRGFRFEETGTFTSTTFRGLFSRFKPTKK